MPVILVVLAAVYVYYFTDWFKPKVIQIFYTCRTNRAVMNQRRRTDTLHPATVPVFFGLSFRYRLNELKVYRLTEWQTNHAALPIWHLISSSNSIPIKQFFYGQPIHGMLPGLKDLLVGQREEERPQWVPLPHSASTVDERRALDAHVQ